MNFEQFTEQSRAQGYEEVSVRDWPALEQVATHTHPFAASVFVARGEVWLTVGQETRHLQSGDRFTIEKGVEHAERYGSEGATFWSARRS